MDKDKRKAQDFADQQAELSGVSTGRQDRFLRGDASRRNGGAERARAADRAFQTQLDLLLTDPVYRAAYTRVVDLLDQAQAKLDVAMAAVAATIDRLTDLTEDMETDAARLPDGRAVFLGSDGKLYTADGDCLGPVEDHDIAIPKDAPSWDQFRGARDALRDAKTRMRRYGDIQDDVLTPARDRVSDPDNPPSLDDLKKIEDDIKRAMDQIETAPPMSTSFEAAIADTPSSDEPDLALIDDLGLSPVTKR